MDNKESGGTHCHKAFIHPQKSQKYNEKTLVCVSVQLKMWMGLDSSVFTCVFAAGCELSSSMAVHILRKVKII